MQPQQLRHQYLQALGVVSWLPREPLSGARPSADWVWQFRRGAEDARDAVDGDGGHEETADAPLQAGTPVSRPERAGPAPASGVGRAALLDSLDAPAAAKAAPPSRQRPLQEASATAVSRLDASRQATPRPEPSGTDTGRTATTMAPTFVPAVGTVPATVMPVPAGAVTALSLRRPDPQDVPEFKLAFLSMADGLIIDSLPPQSRGGLTAAHLRLAMALWRALGLSASQAPSAQLLPWPAFTSRSLDQGWEQAEAAVQRKFDRLLEQSPARFVLLLGESAGRLVLQSREGGEGMRGVLFRPRSQVPALASASLSEMLQVPGCKREVWRDLQPLIRHLADD